MSADEPLTPEQLVAVIFRDVYRAAVADVLSILRTPPGRQPPQRLVEMSTWWSALADDDRSMVERVMTETADAAVFGLLCVLDNVRPATPGFREELSLRVMSADGERPLIPDGQFEELHGLFRGVVEESHED